MRFLNRTVVVVACSVAPLVAASAQVWRAAAERLTPGAVAESLVVLRQLNTSVRAKPNDAAAWNRIGMIAWVLYVRDKAKDQPPIKGIDWTLLGHMADTSFRRAAFADPATPMYRLNVGRYLSSTWGPLNMMAAQVQLNTAMTAAHRVGAPRAIAEAATEVGQFYFRRYEISGYDLPGLFPTGYFDATGLIEYRKIGADSLRDRLFGVGSLGIIREMLGEKVAQRVPTFNYFGEADYLTSERALREALDAEPTRPEATRELSRVLLARKRWPELAALGEKRIASAAWDVYAWLALGLGAYRTGDYSRARTAFDSVGALYGSKRMEQFASLTRLLRPADTAAYLAQDRTRRAATDALYWLAARPLWSRDAGDPRLEFLARLAYAELRWSYPEFGLRGPETDRGVTHIRYGPPFIEVGDQETRSKTWMYKSGFLFSFAMDSGLVGTSAIFDQPGNAGRLRDAQPVRWDNITELQVDSMPARATRFRAAHDSVEVVVAAEIPVAAMRRDADVGGNVRTDFFVIGPGLSDLHRDSVVRTTGPGTSFTRRTGPGVFLYRVEASIDGGLRAARSAGVLVARDDSASGFTQRGFGISDVLFASGATTSTAARRWSDVAFTPIAARLGESRELNLIWENYEFAADSGRSRYEVAVTLRRRRSAAGRIAANVLGAAAGLVGVNRSDDETVIRFERTTPQRDAFVDQIAIGLAGTSPGEYQMTLTITDHVSGRSASRTSTLIVGA